MPSRVFPTSILTFGKVRASWPRWARFWSLFDYERVCLYQRPRMQVGDYLGWIHKSPCMTLKNELTESWKLVPIWDFWARIGLDLTYYTVKPPTRSFDKCIKFKWLYECGYQLQGKVQNKGLEIALNLTPIRTSNGFTWDIMPTIPESFRGCELAPELESLLVEVHQVLDCWSKPGQPYGNIVGYAYREPLTDRRLFQQVGTTLRYSTQQVLGNITPDWIGVLTILFRIKVYTGIYFSILSGNGITSETKIPVWAGGNGKWQRKDVGLRIWMIRAFSCLWLAFWMVLWPCLTVSYPEKRKGRLWSGLLATRAWNSISESLCWMVAISAWEKSCLLWTLVHQLCQKTPFTELPERCRPKPDVLENTMQDMGRVSPEISPYTSAGSAGQEMGLPFPQHGLGDSTWSLTFK